MSTYQLTREGYVLRDGNTKVPTVDTAEQPNTNPDYLAFVEWMAQGKVPDPAPSASNGEIVHALDRGLELHYDARAAERRYTSRFTCALRAGYPGPFQAEGIAFASWMDACNAYAYEVLAAVLSGDRAVPTLEQLLAELPALTWPTAAPVVPRASAPEGETA